MGSQTKKKSRKEQAIRLPAALPGSYHLSVVVSRVDFREPAKLRRKLVQRENRIGRANRNAGAAIDAVVRVHVELRNIREIGLILLRMDAVHRAGLYAELVLRAGVRNYICHMPMGMQSACHLQLIENKMGKSTCLPCWVGEGTQPAGRGGLITRIRTFRSRPPSGFGARFGVHWSLKKLLLFSIREIPILDRRTTPGNSPTSAIPSIVNA